MSDGSLYFIDIQDDNAIYGSEGNDNPKESFYLVSLDDALDTAFSNCRTHFFVYANHTVLLVTNNDTYFLFHPQARDKNGLIENTGDGKALLIIFNNKAALKRQIRFLFSTMNLIHGVDFEITAVVLKLILHDRSKAFESSCMKNVYIQPEENQHDSSDS